MHVIWNVRRTIRGAIVVVVISHPMTTNFVILAKWK